MPYQEHYQSKEHLKQTDLVYLLSLKILTVLSVLQKIKYWKFLVFIRTLRKVDRTRQDHISLCWAAASLMRFCLKHLLKSFINYHYLQFSNNQKNDHSSSQRWDTLVEGHITPCWMIRLSIHLQSSEETVLSCNISITVVEQINCPSTKVWSVGGIQLDGLSDTQRRMLLKIKYSLTIYRFIHSCNKPISLFS